MTRLAHLLVNYSCAVKPGDKVLIEAIDIPHRFTSELIRLTREAGGIPLVKLDSNEIKRSLLQHGSEEGWKAIAQAEMQLMSQSQCYIGVRGSFNISELSDVPKEKQDLYEQLLFQPVHLQTRVPKTRWVVLRWPTPSMAQQAEMSTEAFEDFYFNVCTLDYARMKQAMQPLIALMSRTDRVRLVGPGKTDLSFSVKNIPVVGCAGLRNIPDGEVFTAPIKESVEGVIQYNTPTIYRGVTHQDVCLTFTKGRIVEASSSQTDVLNQVLDSDAGARYIGEFAIGFNPFCTKPMKDILFDEKIAGSIHFTPGNCYDDTDNGNRSCVHWDLVLQQTPDKGGGEIYFDGQLIRKDGRFVLDELQALNPEHLK
jgi:aminopeptidase